jgi:hypothetical protein
MNNQHHKRSGALPACPVAFPSVTDPLVSPSPPEAICTACRALSGEPSGQMINTPGDCIRKRNSHHRLIRKAFGEPR